MFTVHLLACSHFVSSLALVCPSVTDEWEQILKELSNSQRVLRFLVNVKLRSKRQSPSLTLRHTNMHYLAY